MSALIAVGLLVAVAAAAAALFAGPTLARLWRRRRIARRQFPAAWCDIVRRRVPIVREVLVYPGHFAAPRRKQGPTARPMSAAARRSRRGRA